MPATRRAAAAVLPTLVFGLLLNAQPATAAVPNYFSSCAKLTQKFPAGVAKDATAAARHVEEGGSRPATTAKAKKVYNVNKSRLDRDNDGTACES